MSRIHDSTTGMKTKVIISFVLAIVTFVTLGSLAYRSFEKLLEAIHQITEPNDKLRGMNTIIMHLSEAESSSRAYAISRKKEYYNKYKLKIEEVNSDVHSLVSGDWQGRVEKQKLDSISLLLNRKVLELQRFLRSRAGDKVSYTEKALEQIDQSGIDSTSLTTFFRKKSTTTSLVDTVLVYKPVEDIEQAKGIFNKIKKLLSRKEPSVTDQVDTVTRIMHETEYEYDTSEVFQPDTVMISEVKKILQQIRQEEYDHHRSDMAREMRLLEANSVIIEQIKAVIKDLEDSESRYYSRKKKQAHIIVRDNLMFIVLIIVLAFLGCFICILLIFGDISKSNFYKSRLEKAKLRAEQLARAREQFLANVSHELKTPLNAILGFSEQLTKTKMPEEQRSYTSIIYNSSSHLLALVNDVLDMSKIAAEGFKLIKAPFTLQEVMNETYLTFQQKAEDKGIELKKTAEISLDQKLVGDVLRFKQVLFNIADNAIKFTDSGEVVLHVTSQEQKPGKMEVTVSVRDSGIGIPKEQLDRVFDNFYQGDSTMTKKHLGTGLGLAISHKLVLAMGGEIKVESELDVGTCFMIKIPFEVPEEGEKAVETDHILHYDQLKRAHILIIDDDKFNTALQQTILGTKVRRLTCVNSAREALYKLNTHSYDLVLTDIHMPDIDGTQFLKKLRQGKSPNKNISVIAVTADSSKTRKSWLNKYDFDDIIYKPFHEEALLSVVCSSLAKAEVPSTITTSTPIQLSLDTLSVFAGGDTRTIAVLLDVFYDNALKDLKQLRRFFAMKDFIHVKEMAHKMHSPFAQLGLSKVTDHLRSLETSTEMPSDTVFKQIMEDIDKSLVLVKEKIGELEVTVDKNVSRVDIE
ncbi:response regulator [Fulvivirga sp. M361]|uniref:ATP-binding protein n=1 Tax=Fulvivirga sp. M361 TaxID=2594266 RepID=UPI00117B12FB|nr:ATP-binding protein [Fulvivirga sp. M361]TRX48808.1 response regulator [Fulvivirga sp. M361]